MRNQLTFEYILTPGGIEADRTLVFDEVGVIVSIDDAHGREADGYFAMPGLPNAHSHCFQRAMSGFAERGTGEESFWTWRELMYSMAACITPEQLYDVARQAFYEMLKGGFTSAGEFHYLHHLPDGTPSPEMGDAVIRAARDAGIRLVLLPVFYQAGGFGEPALDTQLRFVHDSPEQFLELLSALEAPAGGIAPHSLRAVPPERLAELLEACTQLLGEDFPIHMHICEQRQEVESCRAHYGKAPIELLGSVVTLDDRWSLIHATHAAQSELDLLLHSRANVVLCPVTEAYLGDGLFPAADYVSKGGRIAVGSDSNVRIDGIEELRWLEFGQRLRSERRSQLATAHGLGVPLWRHVCESGASALGLKTGVLRPGWLADIVVIAKSPLSVIDPHRLPDALIVGGSGSNIADVYVGGRKLIDGGQHSEATEIESRFSGTVQALLS